MELQEFRRQFPVTRSHAYLLSGALAPAALSVRAAAEAWLHAWSDDPVQILGAFRAELEGLRAAFSELIGANADEIVVTDGTSRAAILAVRLLQDYPGDVLVDDTTYPSSIYPWLVAANRPLRYVPSDHADEPARGLMEALAHRPAGVVAISHVAPFTGLRHNLERLAEVVHAQSALLFVDAAQSTGVMPIDVRRDGIDVLVTTAMKWLLGPPGIGFLYIRRELLDQAPRVEVGYFGARPAAPGEWPPTELPPLAEGGRKFEPGMPSLSGLAAASAGIGLIRAVGTERIQQRIEGLVSRCIDGLRERGLKVRTPELPNARAGVVAAEYPQASEVVSFLREREVDIGTYQNGVFRVDPHAFCIDDDVDRLLDGLDRFEATSASKLSSRTRT
jgi:selenocysteine lyase/cysteine desulfurase